MGLDVEDRLRQLVGQMKVAGYNSHIIRLAKERVNELQQRGVHCVDRFVHKLLDRVSDKEDYLDILTEGRFAVILVRNGFSEVTFVKEKKEQKLPDIKAKYNKHAVYFEVTRSRPGEDDRAVKNRAAFVSQDSVESIISKIQDKMRQLQSGSINIVVIWSDTVNWLPRNMKEAFKYIEQESLQNPGVYKKLSGVLFGGGMVDMATLKQFYLFENREASKPLGSRLFNKLDNLHERNINQLQREKEELAAAFRRLKAQDSL